VSSKQKCCNFSVKSIRSNRKDLHIIPVIVKAISDKYFLPPYSFTLGISPLINNSGALWHLLLPLFLRAGQRARGSTRTVPTAKLGGALAHAVSRWFPTAAARVRALVKSCGVYGGERASGAGFLRVLWLLMSISCSYSCSTIIIIIIYHPVLVQEANKWPQQ
jgi:hypothetical protein